ncbi:ATP-binding protein [Dactylosporangium darangshiense]|uniref:ATP-binding protein n=1 Tax=Dactylosporangium darangshiense TaxID=579108 RepID=UPI00362BE74D
MSGPELVGRDEDVAAVRSFVDRASTEGGALVVYGDAGVGKSALIEDAAAYAGAKGVRLLRATGTQFEAQLSFAGLHQLLYPLLGRLDELGDGPRAALRSALGLHAGGVPDRMAISHAALELLALAAADGPVLAVVDDLPWLDQASAHVLGFVARRAAGSGVGLLAAARTGEDGGFDRAGIPARQLQPLSAVSAQLLLDSRYPDLGVRSRRRLLQEARGNPSPCWSCRSRSPTGRAPGRCRSRTGSRRCSPAASAGCPRRPAARCCSPCSTAPATCGCCAMGSPAPRPATWPRRTAPGWSPSTAPPRGSRSATR